MLKIKNLVTAAACGFVLSFLISIVSTHKPGVSLVRGLIFALVGAVLCFAIDLLNSKFLELDPLASDSTDDSKRSAGTKAGSMVNITIDDENLTEEDQSPAFNVSAGSNPFAYKPQAPVEQTSAPETPAPVAAPSAGMNEAAASAAPAGTGGFTPVELGKPVNENEKAINDPAPSGTSAPEPSPVKKASGVKEIDALPDIGEFADQGGDDSSGDSSVASVINDSEFAQSGNISASNAMTEGGEVLKQDSKIIASAIRTLLKKED
ncbi:MAG: hypothetical protein KBS64_04685 [Treponema sp.]|nr:hypothetical protein [Candidatus Treponema equi]